MGQEQAKGQDVDDSQATRLSLKHLDTDTILVEHLRGMLPRSTLHEVVRPSSLDAGSKAITGTGIPEPQPTEGFRETG